MRLLKRRHKVPSLDEGQIAALSDKVNSNYEDYNGTRIHHRAVDDDNYSSSSDPDDIQDDELKPSNIHVFSASSTLHGFSHIFASHHSTLRRFSWAVAFLTSLTLFLLQVCQIAFAKPC